MRTTRTGSATDNVMLERERLALALVWCKASPERVGELVFPTAETMTIGRGTGLFFRQRPGVLDETGPLLSPSLSRSQLEIRVTGPDAITIGNVGRRILEHAGAETSTAVLAPGQTVTVRDEFTLLAVTRPVLMAGDPVAHGFGEADEHGIVGESRAAAVLREAIRFAADREQNALVWGPPGTGKQMAANAVLPDAKTVDTSLEIPTGSVIIDRLDHASEERQKALLRQVERSERVVAIATDPEALLPELRFRFPIQVRTPGLGERREDVPLILAHLWRRIEATDGHPKTSAALIDHLLGLSSGGVREIETALYQSIQLSEGRLNWKAPAVRIEPTSRVMLSAGYVDLERLLYVGEDDGVELTPLEAALLGYLAARPRKAISREELLTEVWGYAPTARTRTLDNTVVRLRRKIEVDPSEPAHVVTVRGVGYTFEPP